MERALVNFAHTGGGGGILITSVAAKLICVFESAIFDSGMSTPALNAAGEDAVLHLIQLNNPHAAASDTLYSAVWRVLSAPSSSFSSNLLGQHFCVLREKLHSLMCAVDLGDVAARDGISGSEDATHSASDAATWKSVWLSLVGLVRLGILPRPPKSSLSDSRALAVTLSLLSLGES